MNLLLTKPAALLKRLIEYKISIKELYFSLTSWSIILAVFLAFSVNFDTTLAISNIIIAFLIALALALFTNRILLSAFLTLLIAVSLEYVRQVKWQFLLQDLSVADFFMLKLLINHGLMRMIYEYATADIYVIFILLLINIFLMANKSDCLLDKKFLGIKNYYALRMVSIGVALLILSKLIEFGHDQKSFFSTLLLDAKNDNRSYHKKILGPFATILLSINDVYLIPQKTKIDSDLIISKLPKRTDIISSLEEMPDIVIILNESVFNPSFLDYNFASDLNFEFFTSHNGSKYSGILNVNTYGGSSWISEYEVNTGISHKFFTGPAYMPFISLAPITNNSLFLYLKSVGYSTEVIYPVDKNFSMAESAYGHLGSDRITDIYEYGYKPKGWSKVPDRVIGDMIINALDKNPNTPKYIFAATMLNHGPHANFHDDDLGCSTMMNDKLCSKLNDYISRLRTTNTDQMQLIKKIMSRKKKTILVNFGDHLPSFEGYSTQLRFVKKINNYYKTFFNITANFPINEQEKESYLSQGNIDIEFISGLVLDLGQINNDIFYRANSFMRKACVGSLKNCLGSKDENIVNLYESYKNLAIKQVTLNHKLNF